MNIIKELTEKTHPCHGRERNEFIRKTLDSKPVADAAITSAALAAGFSAGEINP